MPPQILTGLYSPAKNKFVFPVQNRLDYFVIILWIVFQVCILNHKNISGSIFKSGFYRPALTEIFFMKKISDPRNIFQNFSGAVSGPVINHNYFFLQTLYI